MNAAGLAFLLLAHYFSGRGLLRLLGAELQPVALHCLSLIVGVPIVSLAPCLLQLKHLPISEIPVILSITIISLLCATPLVFHFKKPRFSRPTFPMYYEWPFIFVFLVLAFISFWRGFFYPPFARDMLAGPELLAEYAVREKTMISSVFTIDLQTTNNYFKSPFITSLQIIYKLLVCPFGQVWLSVLAFPFWIWLYSMLKTSMHPILAGFLLLLFLAIPELYSYSYVLLYDFSNMIFFFSGFYMLYLYYENPERSRLFFPAVLFGIATYIRTETLVLVVLVLPLIWAMHLSKQTKWNVLGSRSLIFLVFPMALYFLCQEVFVRSFIPIPFELNANITQNFGDVSAYFTRFLDMNSRLIFSKTGIELYGYFIFFFLAVLLADLAWQRRVNKPGRIALYGIALVYLGMPLLFYLFPLVDLDNTTKRGLFKLLPLMLWYLGNSSSLRFLSVKIREWEEKVPAH